MAHNDHLQQPIIERRKGEAKGVYYKGVALTSSDFILIAPTIDLSKDKWAMFTDIPLNVDKCIAVSIFSRRDTKDLTFETERSLNREGSK